MGKKLAIFCDGTWNDLSLASPTNVVRLAKCVETESAQGHKQIVYYDEGVGVGSNISWVADTLTRFLGGALGRGLDRKIEAAYRFLVLNYEPGDDIYLFGFSRGAYTARSLGGLIRKCGILRRSCFNRIPEAIRRYRDSIHPSDAAMIEFRARYAHDVAAGAEDHARIGIVAREAAGQPLAFDRREDLYQYRPAQAYRMMYVGLWDTVGAMGVPRRFDILKLNSRYAFHDTSASSLIGSIRHAVATDEKRGLFDLAPVDNIDSLNAEWAKMTGWNVSNPASASYVPYAHRPYQQRWFPGDHGSSGGGHADTELSSAALLWIAAGAEWAGLRFCWEMDSELDKARTAADPIGALGPNGARAGRNVGGTLRGKGPGNIVEVAPSAYERHCRTAGAGGHYQPVNITQLVGAACPVPAPEPPPAGFPPEPPATLFVSGKSVARQSG